MLDPWDLKNPGDFFMRNGFDISFGFGCLCRFMEPKKIHPQGAGGYEEHDYTGSET